VWGAAWDRPLVKMSSLKRVKVIFPMEVKARRGFFRNILRHRMYRKLIRQIASENMKKFGIPDTASRYGSYPHEFSCGQRPSIAAAHALALNQRLIFNCHAQQGNIILRRCVMAEV
jgi:ABC-type dipeptide/oligopeptide/nickel transport system ATPase component